MGKTEDLRVTLLAALMVVSAGSAGAQPFAVGEAKLIVRMVWGTVETTRRQLAVDADVYWQELIETAAESAAKMQFLDGTTLSTGPDSRVRIDEFVYVGGPGASKVVIDIGRGIMRFVSGVSPSAAYRLRTPTAMIGVRGTDFTVTVGDDGTTRVLVRRGEIELTAGASGASVVVRAGEASAVEAGGMAPPAEPAPPDGTLLGAATEVTAMLAVEATGDPRNAVTAADVAALGGSKAAAAATRAGTVASQTGAGCSGC